MVSGKDDWEKLQSVMTEIGIAGELWLCRGAVRCQILGELQAWDDFDVIAEESELALHSGVQRLGIHTWQTFHGGHSFQLPSGRKVDIWSVSSTRGQRCTSLAEALFTFEFNVDAIARSLQTGRIVDPLGVQEEILSRQLRVQGTLDPINNVYMPWKAAYLVIRHRFLPDASVARLWARAPTVVGLPEKAVAALRDELRQLHVKKDLEEVRAMLQRYPRLSEYASALILE